MGRRQSVLWGAGYRLQQDQTARAFIPLSREMPLYSGFVQDEITFVPDQLKLTVGSKFLHNVFSGFEIQPSTRLAWTPYTRHTIWTAVSRAVRLPTRFDSDITVTPGLKFGSEKVIAYELGYRVRPVDQLSLSFATFYNQYHHLRSLDSTSSPQTPIVLANSQHAESWGFEFSGNFRATEWWRLRGGYTYFAKNIWANNTRVLPISAAFEGVDPKNIAMLQSIMDLPNDLQLDVIGRYADKLPAVMTTPAVPAYFTFDARLARQMKSLEISIVGQNLFQNQHTESGLSKIPRSIYAKITCQF
jgi:iron complex outermembrane receptor protein